MQCVPSAVIRHGMIDIHENSLSYCEFYLKTEESLECVGFQDTYIYIEMFSSGLFSENKIEKIRVFSWHAVQLHRFHFSLLGLFMTL